MNDRVQLGTPAGPEGTVTRLTPDGQFRVSYDSHGRKRWAPRQRMWYPAGAARNFHTPFSVDE